MNHQSCCLRLSLHSRRGNSRQPCRMLATAHTLVSPVCYENCRESSHLRSTEASMPSVGSPSNTNQTSLIPRPPTVASVSHHCHIFISALLLLVKCYLWREVSLGDVRCDDRLSEQVEDYGDETTETLRFPTAL